MDESGNPQGTGVHVTRLHRHRTKLVCVLIVLGFCLGGRAVLPYVMRSYVNHALNSAPGYSGHVDGIQVSLWRGSYTIVGLEVRQNDSSTKEPLFSSPRTELSVLWGGILDGAPVAEVKTYDATLTFAGPGGDHAAQTGKDAKWGEILKKLTHFSIDHFEAINGQIHYLDRSRHPPVDVYLSKVDGDIRNLANSQVKQGQRVATLHATALAMGQANVDVDLTTNPNAEQPDFALKARLMNLEATRMKDFVQAYTLFDPKAGTLDVIVQATAKDGKIDGYVKPLFHDLQLLSLRKPEKEENPLHLVTDVAGSILNLLLQNQSKQQLATQIPFSGRVDDPGIDFFAAAGNLLKNAMIKAFTPEFEKAGKP